MIGVDDGMSVMDSRARGRTEERWYQGYLCSTQTGDPSLEQGLHARNLQTNMLPIYSSFQEVDEHGLGAVIPSCLLSLEMKG